jgi:hypothetical protein
MYFTQNDGGKVIYASGPEMAWKCISLECVYTPPPRPPKISEVASVKQDHPATLQGTPGWAIALIVLCVLLLIAIGVYFATKK